MSENQVSATELAAELQKHLQAEGAEELPAPEAWKATGNMLLALTGLQVLCIVLYYMSHLTSLMVIIGVPLVLLVGLTTGLGILKGSRTARNSLDLSLVPTMTIVLAAALAGEEEYQVLSNAPYLILPLLAVFGCVGVMYRSWFATQQRKFDNSPASVEALQKSLALAEVSPALSPEEFESKPDLQKTGQMILAMTGLEVICLVLYNPDMFSRISAALADGFGAHFPGGAVFSILIAILSGLLCAQGMFQAKKWTYGFSEMRGALGAGQVLVYLLLSELVVSDEPWRLVPFFLLLGVMVMTYVFMGRIRQSYYQAKA